MVIESRLVRMVAGLCLAGAVGPLPGQTVTVAITGAGNTTSLRWQMVSGVSGFPVERRQVAIDAKGMVQPVTAYVLLATVTGMGYNDVLPIPAVYYEYRVSALLKGTAYPAPAVRYLAPPFTTATNLTATGTASQADLKWTAAFGVTGYHVWRRTLQRDGSIANLVQRTPQPLPAPGFSDPALVPTEAYEFQVVSLAQDGTTWPSPWVRYAPPPPAAGPVLAVAGAADRVLLGWTPSAGATGYHISRYLLDRTGRRMGGGQITASPVVGSVYTDALPAPGAYQYQIVALLPDGSTVPSQPVSYGAPAFTTPVGVAAAAVGLRGIVTWSPAPGVAGYQVWRRFVNISGKGVNLATQVGTVAPGATFWLDGLPDPKSLVEYQVIGVSGDGRTWPSAWVRGR